MSYKELYNEWLSNPYFDEETKEELRVIANDEKEIEERFYTELEFGTAGLRGVIGAGVNRMNIYVVRKATQGLANYIIKMNSQDKGVAIAYDSRRMSPEFADEAARVLAQTESKHLFLNHYVLHRSSHLQSESLDVLQVLILQPATILLNIMDTRFTGQMVRRLHHLMTKELWMRLSQSQTFLQ